MAVWGEMRIFAAIKDKLNQIKHNMSSIQIIQGDFAKQLRLQLAPGIRAGFPSPADDYQHNSLDFNHDLIRNPEATFYGRVVGDSMIEASICDGDIAVIDRSVEAQNGDVVVAFINEEFTIKYLDLTHRAEGYIELRPANPLFKSIRINADDDFKVWGVVVWTIKKWKR